MTRVISAVGASGESTMASKYLWRLLSLFLVSSSCFGAGMNFFSSKYIYQASESAPKNYVMTIVAGSLSYNGGSRYIPNGSDIDNGWGIGASSHVVETAAPLPKSLGILFFSYHENQFYRGRFDLPYDKIAKLFKEGHYSPKEGKHITYDAFVVGVAPGGAVAVWAESLDKTTEVFFGQAEKTEEEWSAINRNPRISREEFISRRIKESIVTPEAIAAAKKNGPPIGLWNRYRTRYSWRPEFNGLTLREGRISMILYYNGERDYLDYPLNKASAANTRAIPKEMVFIGAPAGKEDKLVELYFNEPEIFEAFKKLGSNDQTLQLEIRMEVVNGKNNFTIHLRNDKESIQLKRTESKVYTA